MSTHGASSRSAGKALPSPAGAWRGNSVRGSARGKPVRGSTGGTPRPREPGEFRCRRPAVRGRMVGWCHSRRPGGMEAERVTQQVGGLTGEELQAEQAMLDYARRCLEAMRRRAEGLRAAGGDAIADEVLAWRLALRVASLVDDGTTGLFVEKFKEWTDERAELPED